MIAFPLLRAALPLPARPPVRRAPAAPAPAPALDRFERQRPPAAAMDGGNREALVAQLAKANAGLTWAAAPSEKIRLLAGMAKLRTDAAADTLMAAYVEGAPGLTVARQAGLARTFQALLTPGEGTLTPAKRDEAIAFVLKHFQAHAFNGDVQLQLGYALALSGSDVGAEALIAHYRRSPATGAEGVHRPLYMLAFCPHPKVSAFLAGEYERLAGNEPARTQVLATLLDQLDRAAP